MNKITIIFLLVMLLGNSNAQTFKDRLSDFPILSNTYESNARDVAEYRGAGDDPSSAIEIKIIAPLGTPENIADLPCASTFVIPSENGTTGFDENDVLTTSTNSSDGNMSICTKTSNGDHLAQNFVPNDETVILEIWASSIIPHSEFHLFQINVPAQYENWCISYDQIGWGFDFTEDWIPVQNGEVFIMGFMDPLNVNFQEPVFLLKFEPTFYPATISLTNSEIGFWEPGQESASVTFTAEGNWETVSWDLSQGTFEGSNGEIIATFPEPGNYTVMAEATGQCSTNATAIVEVTIECTPMVLELDSSNFEVTLSESGQTNLVINFEFDGIEYIFSSFGDENPYLDLNNGTGSISIAMDMYFAGTYGGYIYGYNDCGQIQVPITITVNEFTSVENYNLENFKLFPNPSDGESLLIQTENHGGIETIEVFNSIGALIQLERVPSIGTNEIDFTQKLPSGAYFVRLTSAEQSAIKQFTVR